MLKEADESDKGLFVRIDGTGLIVTSVLLTLANMPKIVHPWLVIREILSPKNMLHAAAQVSTTRCGTAVLSMDDWLHLDLELGFPCCRRNGGGESGSPQTLSPPPARQSSRAMLANNHKYSAVPTMELTPVSSQQLSSATSEAYSGGGDTAQGQPDRRRGRLNSELLSAVLEGNLEEVTR
ncbi:hypothetical protein J6590_097035 [Homalodisca vitripennis]|nr:hypothetical protein J6590_097035 [Homalodisca vitripennis]